MANAPAPMRRTSPSSQVSVAPPACIASCAAHHRATNDAAGPIAAGASATVAGVCAPGEKVSGGTCPGGPPVGTCTRRTTSERRKRRGDARASCPPALTPILPTPPGAPMPTPASPPAFSRATSGTPPRAVPARTGAWCPHRRPGRAPPGRSIHSAATPGGCALRGARVTRARCAASRRSHRPLVTRHRHSAHMSSANATVATAIHVHAGSAPPRRHRSEDTTSSAGTTRNPRRRDLCRGGGGGVHVSSRGRARTSKASPPSNTTSPSRSRASPPGRSLSGRGRGAPRRRMRTPFVEDRSSTRATHAAPPRGGSASSTPHTRAWTRDARASLSGGVPARPTTIPSRGRGMTTPMSSPRVQARW